MSSVPVFSIPEPLAVTECSMPEVPVFHFPELYVIPAVLILPAGLMLLESWTVTPLPESPASPVLPAVPAVPMSPVAPVVRKVPASSVMPAVLEVPASPAMQFQTFRCLRFL